MLDFDHGLGEFPGRGEIANPQAGHGVGLGKPVDGDGPLPHARERGQRYMLQAVVHELFVDLVRNHDEIALNAQLGELGQAGRRDHAARGIVGRDDCNRLGPGGDARGDIIRCQGKVKFLRGRDGHYRAAGQTHHVVVGVVARLLQQQLVTGTDKGLNQQVQGFLTTVRHHDLIGRIVQPVVRSQLVGNGFPQFGKPRRQGVVRVPGRHRNRSRLHYMGRGVEVGIPPAQGDYVIEFGRHREHAGAEASLHPRTVLDDSCLQHRLPPFYKAFSVPAP